MKVSLNIQMQQYHTQKWFTVIVAKTAQSIASERCKPVRIYILM